MESNKVDKLEVEITSEIVAFVRKAKNILESENAVIKDYRKEIDFRSTPYVGYECRNAYFDEDEKVSHFMIDGLKIIINNNKNQFMLQAVHFNDSFSIREFIIKNKEEINKEIDIMKKRFEFALELFEVLVNPFNIEKVNNLLFKKIIRGDGVDMIFYQIQKTKDINNVLQVIDSNLDNVHPIILDNCKKLFKTWQEKYESQQREIEYELDTIEVLNKKIEEKSRRIG